MSDILILDSELNVELPWLDMGFVDLYVFRSYGRDYVAVITDWTSPIKEQIKDPKVALLHAEWHYTGILPVSELKYRTDVARDILMALRCN